MCEPKLTFHQSYDAMYAYLFALWKRTGNDELAGLLGDMSFVPGGQTADPAAWLDWLECVDKSMNGKVDSMLRSEDGSIIDVHGVLKENKS